MSKVAILKVGYQAFALPPKADIATILKVFSQAEPVDSAFVGNEIVFFPDRRRASVSVEYVEDTQLLAEQPTKRPSNVNVVTKLPTTAAIEAAKQLRLEGGDHAS